VLLVGDPLQLPATVTSRKAIDLGLARSLQERLMFDCDYKSIMLDVQYRMKPEISSFPRARFYGSAVVNGENVVNLHYQSCLYLLDGRPCTYFQVSGIEQKGFGGSYTNEAEARVVVDLVSQLRAQALSTGDPMLQSNWCSADQIRVITYYSNQVNLLKRLLREKNLDKVVVSTVDAAQGSEADIVLLSFVRSQGASVGNWLLPRSAAGFLTDDRRMNVSLTRARHQLIGIGNIRQMMALGRGAETLSLLARDAEDRNLIMDYPPPRNEMIMASGGNARFAVNAQLDRFYGDENFYNNGGEGTFSEQLANHYNKKPRYF